MLFNSFEFLFFLPIVFLLYWFVFRPYKWQNLLVVVSSYVFYGWWDWRFLLLIAFTTICSYGSGLLIEYFEGKRKKQQLVSASNILLNFAILGVFKYYNFFAENFEIIIDCIGLKADWPTLNVILPVGISFYTFQALSYTIDVYRGKIKATRDIIAFFAFISFFPQLVAGPIERATNLLPQFLKSRTFNYESAVDGSRQMLWGFFKKIVVADNCAYIVNLYWGDLDASALQLWVLAILFSFQIYCDFSGYSDIAIGCAKLFGINLMRNFNVPYFSRSIPEFWRRWHISLMTWFRDYVYFPLGGSRCEKLKVIRNVFIVWGISGLWHGANWTFVCWGLYHAILLAVYNIIGVNTKYNHVAAYDKILPSFKETTQIIFTFLLAVVGWIIFRSDNIQQSIDMLSSMFTNNIGNISMISGRICLLGGVALLIVEWFQREKEHALQLPTNGIFKFRVTRWTLYLLLIVIIDQFGGKDQTFIYFQF